MDTAATHHPRRRQAHDDGGDLIQTKAEDVVRLVDPERFDAEPHEAVARHVQREHLAVAEPVPTFSPHDADGDRDATDEFIEERRVVQPDRGIAVRAMGDVDFEGVSRKASLISPVPGGVGPMTITMLLHNTLVSAERGIAAKG